MDDAGVKDCQIGVHYVVDETWYLAVFLPDGRQFGAVLVGYPTQGTVQLVYAQTAYALITQHGDPVHSTLVARWAQEIREHLPQ